MFLEFRIIWRITYCNLLWLFIRTIYWYTNFIYWSSLCLMFFILHSSFLCLCVFLEACAVYLLWSLSVRPVGFWPAVFELFSMLWAPLSCLLSVRSVSVGRVSSGRGGSDGSESCRAGQFGVWRGVQRCSYAQTSQSEWGCWKVLWEGSWFKTWSSSCSDESRGDPSS